MILFFLLSTPGCAAGTAEKGTAQRAEKMAGETAQGAESAAGKTAQGAEAAAGKTAQGTGAAAGEAGQEPGGRTGKALPVSPEKLGETVSWTGRMELSYAEGFAVDYYEGGYALISLTDGSRFLVYPQEKKAEAEEELELPEGTALLQQPVDHIYLAATAVMDMFRELGAVETIGFSGTDAEGWEIAEAREAMEKGEMVYAGKYSAPDYERILEGGCRLAVENTMIHHSPEIREKLESLGIPVLIDYSSYESHPLGRTEWIRLYGVLTGREEEAGAAFDAQIEALERVQESVSRESGEKKTVAFFYVTSNGAVNVRKSADYVPKMIGLAGGAYIFDNLGDEESRSSSVNMQMEEFYAAAREADYLIYNSTVDGSLRTVGELLDKAPVLEGFRAVQEGNVWCTTQNLYQESMAIGPMIEDIYHMLSGGAGAGRYLYRLEP